MSIGQRKRKLVRVTFEDGTPVNAIGDWQLNVEDSAAKDYTVNSGQVNANLGPWSTAKNLTLDQVRTTLLALISAIPGHDVVS